MQTHLKIYNQSVRIETRNPALKARLENFLAKYYTLIQKGFGKAESTEKLFASKLKNRPIWYLHRNQFAHFLHELKNIGEDLGEYSKEDFRDYKIAEEDYIIRPNWVLREDQIPVKDFLVTNPVHSKLIPLVTGSGKAQPLDARIKIPGGWSTMGEMKVGAEVIAKDGTTTIVTGVYPQGVTPVYEVKLADGRVTKASKDHLWHVYIFNDLSNSEELVTTTELKTLIRLRKTRIYLDLCDSEQSPDKELPISPYQFGREIHEGKQDIISEEYLNASHKQRLELIQGISDNAPDIVAGRRRYIISLPTRELAKQFQYLIRSIGGYCSLDQKGYTVTVKHKDVHKLLTKEEQVSKFEWTNVRKIDRLIRVTSVIKVGEEETQCISIEHESKLYITDDFIVTHNTMISLYAVGELKQRLGIIILPQFAEKWMSDVIGVHDAEPKDVMMIQGSKSVASIIQMAKDGDIKSKYFIFSSRTIQDYISMYENEPDMCVEMYGCEPTELFPLLGIGVLLIDETHMAFHSTYKTIIHTNVKYQIGLSATLMSDDTVVARTHKVVYPSNATYGDNMLKKYMDIYAIAYSLNPSLMNKIKTTNYGSTYYSHTAFEQSIMKNKHFLDNYYRIVKTTIDDYYVEHYMEKDKLVVFVSTIALATIFVKRLEEDYPNKKVVRYCEEDSYDEMLTGDFIVSTIGSLGTGIDIPNLRVVVQTVSIASAVSNLQSAGRLRYLKDRDVKFCYIYCESLPKHKQYHLQRVETFKSRAASYSYRRSRVSFGN